MHCFIARLGVEGIMRIANTCFLPMVFLFYSDLKRIRTFVAKRREMLKIRAFWYLWDLKRIRTFVAKRCEMSKIRAFWYHFWLRFDSDIWSKKWWVEPLVHASVTLEEKTIYCNFIPTWCAVPKASLTLAVIGLTPKFSFLMINWSSEVTAIANIYPPIHELKAL